MEASHVGEASGRICDSLPCHALHALLTWDIILHGCRKRLILMTFSELNAVRDESKPGKEFLWVVYMKHKLNTFVQWPSGLESCDLRNTARKLLSSQVPITQHDKRLTRFDWPTNYLKARSRNVIPTQVINSWQGFINWSNLFIPTLTSYSHLKMGFNNKWKIQGKTGGQLNRASTIMKYVWLEGRRSL